uniref:Maf protein n=1 Tax=Rhizophora mucronata TaxID=61149 RepID=A0A2P2KVQ6_RHIMU
MCFTEVGGLSFDNCTCHSMWETYYILKSRKKLVCVRHLISLSFILGNLLDTTNNLLAWILAALLSRWFWPVFTR